MTNKKDLVFILACAMVVLTVPIIAKAVDVVAPTSEERAQQTTDLTQEFVRKATSSNMLEIETSKLALQRTKNAEVKAFAQQMIADHTKASKEMAAAVKKAKIDPTIAPKEMEDSHQDILNALKKSSDTQFDEDYIDAQEDAHDEAVSLFEKYAQDGDNEAIKQFATKTLPVLKKHDAHVEKLEDME